MTKIPTADEHLFRQFRRGWMPVWLDNLFRGTRPLLNLVLIAVAVTVLSWAALTYLPRSTGQETGSVESWRQRIDNAKASELVPVFQSLYQVKNDRVIDLGVNYMLSADAQRRDAARVALEDSLTVWKQWDDAESSPHIQRVAESLSRQVLMFNGPEQATAVEVARQFLLWPTGNREDHTQLLLACETIFRNARAAFTDRPPSDPESNASLAPAISAADQVAASLLNDEPTTFVARSESRFFSAGYRKPANNENQKASAGVAASISEVPMMDEDGNALGIRTIDPSTMNLPGGLIPVQLSGERKRSITRPDLPSAADAAPPQETITEVIERRNNIPPAIVPGEQESESTESENTLPTFSEPRRLNQTIPRVAMQENARPLRETMQRNSMLPSLRPAPDTSFAQPPLEVVPGREPAAWVPPNKPLRRWAHIDVMKLLQSPKDAEVEAAEQELTRRGFNRSYISVAYRLTSHDPLERYNLVFELAQMQRVEPIPFLKWLSADAHEEVRTAAMEQLNRLVGNGIR